MTDRFRVEQRALRHASLMILIKEIMVDGIYTSASALVSPVVDMSHDHA